MAVGMDFGRKMQVVSLVIMTALLHHAGATCYNGTAATLCDGCSAFCVTDGCYCSADNSPCVPTNACELENNYCCSALVSNWFWDSTLKCCSDQVHCYPECPIDQVCQVVSGGAQCVCNKTLYNGTTLANLKPTVSCSDTVMTSYIGICELQLLGYDYTTMHPSENSLLCNNYYTDIINNTRVAGLQIALANGTCGTTVTNDSTNFYFSNTIHIDLIPTTIITKNPIAFNISCAYNRTMEVSFNFSVTPGLSVIYVPSGNGTFAITMGAYQEADCINPLQPDAQVMVGDNVYIAMVGAGVDGNTFVLSAETCLASPINDRNYASKVYLLQGGCPAPNADVQTKVLENGNSTEARIQFNSFLFQGFAEVYIFCDVRLCTKSDGCGVCNNQGRSAPTSRDVLTGLSVRVNLIDNWSDSSSGRPAAAGWIVLAGSLLACLSVKAFL